MAMNKAKAARLKRAGWKVGSVQDFLGLTAEETALIEIKLSVAHESPDGRKQMNLQEGAEAAEWEGREEH